MIVLLNVILHAIKSSKFIVSFLLGFMNDPTLHNISPDGVASSGTEHMSLLTDRWDPRARRRFVTMC